MLNCNEARDLIFSSVARFPDERVPLADACRRVLRQAVTAERDQPPFDRVTMDGIAVRHAALASGRREFCIAGTQHAGDDVQALNADDECIEVMTGSVMPPGADCVIPVERIEVSDGMARADENVDASSGKFIHPRGSDHREGYRMLVVGHRIAPVDIALIASAGRADVAVARQPRVSVISTGNELVAAGAPIERHQVRLSNGPALMAMLTAEGYRRCQHEHLRDDPERMRQRLAELLAGSDVLVLSGGVSMGKADFVPGVLKELGVNVVFHGIAQRPGKPMWFGIGPSGQAVFALPGNPVSTLVCCRHYVLPALLHASGATPQQPVPTRLGSNFTFDADLTCLLPVRLKVTHGTDVVAEPVPTNTSGDFTALSDTDGYVELARGDSDFPRGSLQPLYRWLEV